MVSAPLISASKPDWVFGYHVVLDRRDRFFGSRTVPRGIRLKPSTSGLYAARRSRLKTKGDVQRLIGIDGHVRCDADAFYAPVLDGMVIRNRYAQMKAAGNVE
jgi:hypothetical protein